MNAPFVITLVALALVALVVWVVRSLGEELRGLGDDDGDQDRTAGDEDVTREIERWRDGK